MENLEPQQDLHSEKPIQQGPPDTEIQNSVPENSKVVKVIVSIVVILLIGGGIWIYNETSWVGCTQVVVQRINPDNGECEMKGSSCSDGPWKPCTFIPSIYSDEETSSSDSSTNNPDTNSLQTHKDKEYGLEFKYPEEWGDVIVDDIPYYYTRPETEEFGGKRYISNESIFLNGYSYSKKIGFTNTTLELEITLVDLLDKKIDEDEFLTDKSYLASLEEDRERIELLPKPPYTIFENEDSGYAQKLHENKNGVRYVVFPPGTIGVDLSKSYKMYINNKAIQVDIKNITPEHRWFDEVRDDLGYIYSSGNKTDLENWLKTHPRSLEISEFFDDVEIFIDSFK